MPRDTSRKAPLTTRSTQRVSQLLTGRGTISVPTALVHAVSTSNAPATAATERPMSGTTMNSPGGHWLPGHASAGQPSIGRRKFTGQPGADVRVPGPPANVHLPAYLAHVAPRPHRARPSVLRT